MTIQEINKMNTSTLAYLGDAVFEVIVREKIVMEKPGDVGRAHHTAVRYVSAAGQAKAAKAMIKVFDRKFFDTELERDFTWSRWFFPVLTTDVGLHTLDEYLVENIRYLYTGRHYKGNYRITYDHIHSLGYKSLVGEYYKYRTSK